MATANTFFWGGRWWKPSDKAAFRKHLAQHGVTFGAWAKNHPQLASKMFGGGAGKPAGMSIVEWAGKQYDAENQPTIDALTKDRATAKAESEQYMKNASGIYQALAGMLGDVGPQIGAGYQAAANTELAGGRGFGNQEAARGKAEGDKAAGYLTAAGAPQAAIEGVKAAAGGEESGNVVYGTGGYIPATSTAREGAAFAAAGSMLPAQAVGQGQVAIRGAMSDAMKNDAEIASKIAEVRGGRAAGIQKIIQDFMENSRAERALRLQEGYLGNTKRSTTAKITGVDPATGQPTYEATYDKNKTIADAKKARDAAKTKDATARASAVKARESAFSTAQHSMSVDAKEFAGHPTTTKEQMLWWAQHPKRKLSDAPKHAGGLSYAQAKQRLFAKYSDLLRYATASGRPALKRRLNQMIDTVLTSYGIRPAAPGSSPPPALTGAPTFAQLGKKDRG